MKVADALWAEPAIPLPRKQSKIEVPLIEDPAYFGLSHKSFADLLNKRGIVTPRKLQWNEGNVVRMHKSAKAIVREREQLERELDAEDALQAATSNTVPACTMISQKAQTLEPIVANDTTADDEDDPDNSANDPFWGMF
ncbi:hypothetical protein [Pseudorhodobacter antarcticus]|uniref:hypothetical protein n=1 Tax=Pseudorhodobacter antarcticus TaxID=1077947 RepID=UPI00067DF03D|nr:hypothetical protein [Pseudorhodobacter antarcticus]